MSILEITGNDIKELNDSDLRKLVGLLCEADLRLQGIPTSGVTWGGDQRAADGGIDVNIDVENEVINSGYIPTSSTGFQVKEPDMPRNAILKEMRPDDELRESIVELANSSGAYIIVSSNGSTSDTALSDRRDAMREALSDLPNSSDLFTDFYDRGRLASWVRNHPSIILWIRQKIGNPIQGWKPYDNWAYAPGGIEEQYLIDDDVRLHDRATPSEDGMIGVDGINMLRNKLSQPRTSIRLTGLSGVGKTRMVQALFDDRIGENPLNPTQVFYADMGDKPQPEPQNFIEQIIAHRTRGIVVIDNCSPELHRQLNRICTDLGSIISLITVEYDVREDQPEETDVFHLEPASKDLIEKMLKLRFKHISQVDARTIAEFSGGNARIAVALAETVKKGETLGDLKDDELFKRLFIQRNDPDNQLLKSAEACSLVYSFDSRTKEGLNHEMQILSELAGVSVVDLHRDIVELKRRQLLQQRNYWKAVLPHAIANNLAKRALENIPVEIILEEMTKEGNERMLISFSRRLGYLHDSEIANQIADQWLSEEGFIGDVAKLNRLGIDLLKNTAPINPEKTLQAIERATASEEGKQFTSRDNSNYEDIVSLLVTLAYEARLFERTTQLLIIFVLSDSQDEGNNFINSVRNQLKSLFLIYLSGTHATAEQRLLVIKSLISNKSEKKQQLGIELLETALKTSYFTSSQQFDFGARSRNTGYWPRSQEEFVDWYRLFVNYSLEIAISNEPVSEKVKLVLVENFPGLWTRAKLFDELEDAVHKITEVGTWNEGWVGIQKTLRYNSKKLGTLNIERLKALREKLKPNILIDKARLYAFSEHGTALELPDTINDDDVDRESERYHLIGEIAQAIGKEVAQDEAILNQLFPDLVLKEGAWAFNFGQGLCDGTKDPKDLWELFKNHLSSFKEKERKFRCIQGFLFQLSNTDIDLYNELLDDALTDDALGRIFPRLQINSKIDNKGVERLHKSLKLELAPLFLYENLAYGRNHENVADEDLSDLLVEISEKEDGVPVAIKILQMRFFGMERNEYEPSYSLLDTGRTILNKVKFDRIKDGLRSEDHVLSEVCKVCFKGEDGKRAAKDFCTQLAKAISENKVWVDDYNQVFEVLIDRQPKVFLDSFYGENNEYKPRRLVWDSDLRSDPFTKLNDDILLEWCEKNPDDRYPVMAWVTKPFRKGKGESKLEWTPLAMRMIESSPVPERVLDNFKNSFEPSSWSGSRAAIMSTRLPLIYDLKDHENPAIADWAYKAEIEFKQRIERIRQSEINMERGRADDYGFE